MSFPSRKFWQKRETEGILFERKYPEEVVDEFSFKKMLAKKREGRNLIRTKERERDLLNPDFGTIHHLSSG